MNTSPLFQQGQKLQLELEVTLLKLERLELLRPDAADHIRTIVAEDIAGKCDDKYRQFPCGPRQAQLVIRRNAIPTRCVLLARIEESRRRPVIQQQQQQHQPQPQQHRQQQPKSRDGCPGKEPNSNVHTPIIPSSRGESITLSREEAFAAKDMQPRVADIATPPLPAAEAPDERPLTENISETGVEIKVRNADQQSGGLLIDLSADGGQSEVSDSSSVAAVPDYQFDGGQFVQVTRTAIENEKTPKFTALGCRDGAEYSLQKHNDEGDDDEEEDDDDDKFEDARSWLGSSPPREVVTELREGEDLMEF